MGTVGSLVYVLQVGTGCMTPLGVLVILETNTYPTDGVFKVKTYPTDGNCDSDCPLLGNDRA